MEIGLWFPVWEIITARHKVEGSGALDDDERLWLILRHAIDEIEQDGLLGLYCSDAPPDSVALLNAWQTIGAEDMLNVFERAVKLLPQGLPPEDEEGREALIALWQEDAYAEIIGELEDDFYELLPQTEELLDEVVKKILEKYA